MKQKLVGIFLRTFACIAFLGVCLYSYLDMQNEITQLKIYLPKVSAEVRRISEENTRLIYEIQAFESPENLMRLAADCEFANLKFPKFQEVITLSEAAPLVSEQPEMDAHMGRGTTPIFASTPSR